MLSIDEQEFNTKYWYTNTKIVTVLNPRKEDFVFQMTNDVGVNMQTGKMATDTRHYRVPAGGSERFPGPIANMYLDQMSKMVAQDEGKIQYLIDFTLRAQYYDQLTADVEDLIHSYTPFPEYLNGADEQKAPENAGQTEVPFAGLKDDTKATKATAKG